MKAVDFPQSNTVFGPPPDLTKEQCNSIPAFLGICVGGSCDGSKMVVVAHQPTAEDIARILAGEPIFLTCMGGLPPHLMTTSFAEAVNIA